MIINYEKGWVVTVEASGDATEWWSRQGDGGSNDEDGSGGGWHYGEGGKRGYGDGRHRHGGLTAGGGAGVKRHSFKNPF